jgi:hypothetical protein
MAVDMGEVMHNCHNQTHGRSCAVVVDCGITVASFAVIESRCLLTYEAIVQESSPSNVGLVWVASLEMSQPLLCYWC